jgi:GMP synthase (glutamine-hydrolysing)
LLGHHLGTEIHKDDTQAKSGSFELSLTEEGKKDPLFEGVSENFIAQYGHKDSLKSTPKNTKLLANGKNCQTSALKHKNNIYSVQFHPEMQKDDLIVKMDLYKDYIPQGKEEFIKNLKDSHESKRILENFIQNLKVENS